jgi:hypothetical protein
MQGMQDPVTTVVLRISKLARENDVSISKTAMSKYHSLVNCQVYFIGPDCTEYKIQGFCFLPMICGAFKDETLNAFELQEFTELSFHESSLKLRL